MNVQSRPLSSPSRERFPGGRLELTAASRGVLELGGLLVVLLGVAVLVYGPHIESGGFIGDAWTTRAWYQLYPHGDFFATVNHFLQLSTMSTRPLNAVYRVLLNDAFGGDMGAWFAWQAISCAAMSALLYLLLRRLRFPLLDSAVIAILVFLFPAATSLRFWTPVIHASLAISLAILGFLLAFSAFGSPGRRRAAALQACSLLLFAASLLLYEVALPIMLASVLLYRMEVPWRRAVRRWLLDLAVLLPIALLVTRSSSSAAQQQSVSGALSHTWRMLGDCPKLLAHTLLPFGGWYAVGAFALLLACSPALLRLLPAGDRRRQPLRRFLGVFAAGALVVLLGYSIYVPGIDYYEPTAPGIADRVNAVAGIGWVLILYAGVGLLAVLLAGRRRRARLLVPAVILAGAIVFLAAWLPIVATDSRDYVAAYSEGQRTLAVVHSALPDPAPGTTIWTFGQPVQIAQGVPVFGNTWDMTDSVALMYRDPTIRSYVGFPGTILECRAHWLVPSGNGSYPSAIPPESSEFASRYGSVYFVNTVTGQFESIDSRGACLRALRVFHLSPELPLG
ncbi:MAG: hypothetical protein ACTHNP_10050 [Solirubrobacterales bacterium]